VAPAVGVSKVDLPADRVVQVELPVDDVEPGRRGGVLEISHPYPRSGVERADGHLLSWRSGDFAATVREPGSDRRDSPGRILADFCRFDRKAKRQPLVVAAAPDRQQLGPPTGELAVQSTHEVQRVVGKNLFEAIMHGADHA
jgi:hypothetical protein